MPYLSELLRKTVTDVKGEPLGIVIDVVATRLGPMPHPQVVALQVRRSRHSSMLVPMSDVAVLVAPAIPLTRAAQDLAPYEAGAQDFFLAQDVLDKQIIDTNGVRVVRVNDLELTRVNGHFYVANVDIGGVGLLRRLGWARLAQQWASRLGRPLRTSTIAWDHVELLANEQTMRLRVPSEKLSDLHPADLAEILTDLNRAEGSRFVESLDVETLAETLEEVEPEFQASLVEGMEDEKVADVLEKMAPDEAADLLSELPEERSEELLRLMESKDADEVRKLLSYPEDCAGGIMTTEYVTISAELSASEAIVYLRKHAAEVETIYAVYVTDAEARLLGVFSLRDLILASPDAPLSKMMDTRPVTVLPEDSQDHVAHVVAKYNLLAVPVVDSMGRLQGIVTVDDALDKIIPTAWKKRLPRMYH